MRHEHKLPSGMMRMPTGTKPTHTNKHVPLSLNHTQTFFK